MKHVTYAEKSLLVGTDAADLLLEYAAALGSAGRADNVEIRAIGVDGEEVVATFLLDPGSSLMAESSRSVLPEPDNDAISLYMRDAIRGLRGNPSESPANRRNDFPFDPDLDV
jgi:hypothetical protein